MNKTSKKLTKIYQIWPKRHIFTKQTKKTIERLKMTQMYMWRLVVAAFWIKTYTYWLVEAVNQRNNHCFASCKGQRAAHLERDGIKHSLMLWAPTCGSQKIPWALLSNSFCLFWIFCVHSFIFHNHFYVSLIICRIP